MTGAPLTEGGAGGRTARRPWVWTCVVVALAALFTWLSLADVSGARRRADGTCCNTEFEHGWWSVAPTLLVVPIYLIGKASWWLMLVAVAVSGAAVFFIASVAVDRTQSAGWGDGLETLSYVEAAFQLLLFVAAGILGLSRRERRLP